ncbi:hypothetical protein NFA_40490 [Nocardia farcinica IFM 10152]|uniref:Uncharacterized protein n=2 Tax=Nocardia farcinica TaxID=37329 RepID=Q5YSE4_NOCFA|nr:hypothetical protein NFA_40490 [Nocardia farcinica IFM 10152]
MTYQGTCHMSSSNPSEYLDLALPRVPAALLDELQAVGIFLRRPIGVMSAWVDERGEVWREVGRVTMSIATGLIDIWPYRDAAEGESLDELCTHAVDVWRNPPSRARGWERRRCERRGDFWWCAVSMPLGDCVTRIVRSSKAFHRQQDERFFAAYASAVPERFGSAA